MKNYYFLIIWLSVLLGCNLMPKKDVTNTSLENIAYTTNSIQGLWTIDVNENVSFVIKGDSIYFFEDLESPLPIKVINDSLMINYGEFETIDKIEFASTQKLILVNFENDTAIYYNTDQDRLKD